MSEKEEMLMAIDVFESLLDWGYGGYGDTEISNMKKINQAIRSLIENMDKKPKVTKDFVEKWAQNFAGTIGDMPECIETYPLRFLHFKLWGIKLLKELGIEIEEGGKDEGH